MKVSEEFFCHKFSVFLNSLYIVGKYMFKEVFLHCAESRTLDVSLWAAGHCVLKMFC